MTQKKQDKKQPKQMGKRQYKNHNVFICCEYVVLDNEEKFIGNFQTLKEALELKEKRDNASIYILKTFKHK